MAALDLEDGRRVVAVYDVARGWWTARVGDSDASAEGRELDRVVWDLFEIPRGGRSPDWLRNVVQRIAERDTSVGPRVMCRCCGSLTLRRYGHYEICPVCRWEDDPTTIFERGESGGPGPNHLSLTEGRRNYAALGISQDRGHGRPGGRAPLPAEVPE